MPLLGCADGAVGLLLGIDASEEEAAGAVSKDTQLLDVVSNVTRAGCVVFDAEQLGDDRCEAR